MRKRLLATLSLLGLTSITPASGQQSPPAQSNPAGLLSGTKKTLLQQGQAKYRKSQAEAKYDKAQLEKKMTKAQAENKARKAGLATKDTLTKHPAKIMMLQSESKVAKSQALGKEDKAGKEWGASKQQLQQKIKPQTTLKGAAPAKKPGQ